MSKKRLDQRMSVPRSSRWVEKLWRSESSVTGFLMPVASAVSWNRRLRVISVGHCGLFSAFVDSIYFCKCSREAST